MSYKSLYDSYSDLKEILSLKKQAIVERNLEQLNKVDEDCKIICECIARFDTENIIATLTDDEKKELKDLVQKVKTLEENNEMLIKHSLGVINNTLSGILNIVQNDKCSYNSKGRTQTDNESMNISSIVEDA